MPELILLTCAGRATLSSPAWLGSSRPGHAMKPIRASAFKMACQKAGSEDHLDPEFAQLSRLAALGGFGAMLTAIAHEINQPLFAIQNYARALTAALSRSRSGNGERLTLWMGQICKRRTAPVQSSTACAISAAGPPANSPTRSASSRRGSGESDAPGSQPPANSCPPRFRFQAGRSLYADRVQVQQVLVNLLKTRARPSQRPGHRTRRNYMSRRRCGKGSIHFSVSDNGCGLPRSIGRRLFEPFFTTKSDGLGIGLAVSRAIIEAVRGRLWAEPNTPRGAVFHFTVPSRKEAAYEQ